MIHLDLEHSGTGYDRHDTCGEESIIAQKVYDQCRSEDCVGLGPVVSGEDCRCVIADPEIGDGNFGRVIWPGRPIRLPEWVTSVKYVKNSFITRSITVLCIEPSPLKGYWNICVEFVFDFKLRMFGACMAPIEIICSRCDTDAGEIKDCLCCRVKYVRRLTLFGATEDTPMTASDILPSQDYSCPDAPHVLVQAKAKLAGFNIVQPEDCCCRCDGDVLDDVYHEPFNYIYVFIAMLTDFKLFRFVCMTVDCKACRPPRACDDLCGDPCALMDFPDERFLP